MPSFMCGGHACVARIIFKTVDQFEIVKATGELFMNVSKKGRTHAPRNCTKTGLKPERHSHIKYRYMWQKTLCGTWHMAHPPPHHHMCNAVWWSCHVVVQFWLYIQLIHFFSQHTGERSQPTDNGKRCLSQISYKRRLLVLASQLFDVSFFNLFHHGHKTIFFVDFTSLAQ